MHWYIKTYTVEFSEILGHFKVFGKTRLPFKSVHRAGSYCTHMSIYGVHKTLHGTQVQGRYR